MTPTTLQCHKESQIYAPQNTSIAMTTTYIPDEILSGFPKPHDHFYHSHHVNVTLQQTPPTHANAHMLRQSLATHQVSSRVYDEKDTWKSKEYIPEVSQNWRHKSQPMSDIPSLGTVDHKWKAHLTETMHPCQMGKVATPSPSRIDLLNGVSFDCPIRYSIPTPSSNISSSLMPNLSTEPPPWVFSKKPIDLLHTNNNRAVSRSPCFSELQNQTVPPQKPPTSDSQSEPFRGVSPHSSTNCIIQTNTLADAQHAFTRLVPQLKTVNTSSYGTFLVSFLTESADHVSLDYLYGMLYRDGTAKRSEMHCGEESYVDQLLLEEKLKTIKLYKLVFESFKRPKTFQDGLFKNSSLSTVNFYEFSRKCLAMKIIFGCIERVKDQSKTLSRNSIYKVYYIICQTLNQRYPEISTRLGLHRNLILGKSKVGILTKLV
ncbi:hypothetical protein JCM33374_g6626 [Metschnikowia sp. JCM 33374]|nr:hypothetical protein JCM33374_g6626 [Metschnikowia sp. JCM 33374]